MPGGGVYPQTYPQRVPPGWGHRPCWQPVGRALAGWFGCRVWRPCASPAGFLYRGHRGHRGQNRKPLIYLAFFVPARLRFVPGWPVYRGQLCPDKCREVAGRLCLVLCLVPYMVLAAG